MSLTDKEHLKQQVNKLQNELNELREYVSAIPENKIWQPAGGGYLIRPNEVTRKCLPYKGYREFGTERTTREQAVEARDAMRVFNRLLAYRDEFMPNPYSYIGDTYTVYCNHHTKEWYSRCTNGIVCPADVIMSYNVASGLVLKLNSGEVVL